MSADERTRIGVATMPDRSTIVRTVLTLMGFAMPIALIAACGTANSQVTPSASVSTLMPGWEQKFELDWQVNTELGGTQRIRGYLVSHYGRSAYEARVLVRTVDVSGAVVGRRIVWVPGGVPGFGRSYFDVPHLSSADHYLVSVWDYSLGKEPSR